MESTLDVARHRLGHQRGAAERRARLHEEAQVGMLPHQVVDLQQILHALAAVLGAFGILIERTMLRRLYKLDHLYGLLLTFGLALIIEGLFRDWFGVSG